MVGSNVWKGRVRVAPSGKSSVICSLVAIGKSGRRSPLVSRAKVRHDIIPDFWDDSLHIDDDLSALPRGKGNLGKKKKASWKTCNNAYERIAATEKEFGKEGCLFVTLTQPSVDKRAFEALARWSSYAVDRMNRIVKRIMPGYEHSRISVWEYQKRGSLHMHLIIGSEWVKRCSVDAVHEALSKGWFSALKDISKRFLSDPFLGSNGKRRSYEDLMSIDGGIHFCNVQRVKFSVCAYLAKYLTDSNHDGKQKLRADNFPIATWVQWNRTATALSEKHTDEFELGYAYIDHRHQLESAISNALCQVKCKEGTSVVPPKNPYNFGGYFLGDPPHEAHNSRVLASCVERIAMFFKPEKNFLTSHCQPPATQATDEEPPHSLVLELLRRRIDREIRVERRRWRDWLQYLEETVILLIVRAAKLGGTPPSPPQSLQLSLINP